MTTQDTHIRPFVSIPSEHYIEGEDFYRYCIWTPVTKKKHYITLDRERNGYYHIKRTYMEDEEILEALSSYAEVGFDDMPEWLKLEMEARNLVCSTRQPTELEQWDTVGDAFEHRVLNKELTIEDYLDHYVKGKDIYHV